MHLVIARGMLGTRVPGVDNPAQGDTYNGAALQSPAEKAKDSGSFCAACFCSLLEDSGRNGRDFQIWDPLLVVVMWQGWGTLVHFGHYPCEIVVWETFSLQLFGPIGSACSSGRLYELRLPQC